MHSASHYGVCFAAQIRVDVKRFRDADFDAVVRQLQSKARIVVLFTGKSSAAHLMAAAKRHEKNGKPSLIWVGCDGWSSRDVVTASISIQYITRIVLSLISNFPDKEYVVEGAITVQPLVRHLNGFDSYFKSLRPESNRRNPWFSEYWQEFFQ